MNEPFYRTVLAVAPLLVGMALLIAGNGLQSTLIPLRAVADGISPATVGYMMSAYYLGYVAGCIFVPRVVQQTGHIRTFATFAALAAAIAIGQALYVEAILWAVLRGLAGFCFAGLAMVVLGVIRAREPWARYQALQRQDRNVARYEAWRGGVRDHSPTGASVAMQLYRRQAQVGVAIAVVGVVLIVLGLALK